MVLEIFSVKAAEFSISDLELTVVKSTIGSILLTLLFVELGLFVYVKELNI
jgi:hypothetical protein